jgi:SecD/SecF fusion protein
MDAMTRYFETLKEKGPKYASDNKFVWCEIENINDWGSVDDQKRPAIVGQFGDKYYVLASNNKDQVMLHRGDVKSWKLTRASPGREPQTGRRSIDFALDDRGGRIFGKITGDYIGRPLCILLDGVAISAPTINSRITTRGQITGRYSEDQQRDMVDKLNAGSLPARLIEQPISIKTIGPSIGADNRNKGIKSGIIGLAGVMLCMAIYYTLGGAIADVALLMNILFLLAIMAGLRATFTLPGIAGVILTIGMSVDANVLIFERIREEQQRGASLRIAIKNGYEKAFSAIFDSNITTIISAAILYWVASEEVKGFALTLMLGLAASLFTALFVTRTIFDFLLSKRIIKDHLVMLHLIRKPNINWMRYRPIFFTLSAVLTIGGIIVFFTRDNTKNNKYDIEFTGGTSAVINLKDQANLTRADVEDRIHQLGQKLGNRALAAAGVYSVGKSGKSYEITTTETNKIKTIIKFPQTGQYSIETVTSAIAKAQDKFAGKLSNLLVTSARPRPDGQDANNPAEFIITASQMNQTLVKNVLTAAFPTAQISEPEIDEVVNNAILAAFAGELEIQQNLQPTIISQEKIAEELINSYPELADFTGGIKILCEIKSAATKEEIEARLTSLQFKPGTQYLRYPCQILDPNLSTIEQGKSVNQFAYISVIPDAGLRELSEDEWTQFVENETNKILAAAKLETSLPRVTQIDPSVGGEQKTRALIAIVLTLIAMLIYIWVRFGDLRFGFGAVVTLFHDTCVNVGMVAACTYIAATAIGEKLLIGDFKIDLTMIAAFLTLLGYSINDTIVVYDRIRENRRKGVMMTLTPQIINNSINETLSRTLLTGTTTLLVVAIMYIFGGKGLRGFNFAILFGIIEGTYSSIAISAPILLLRTNAKEEKSKSH